MNKQHEIAIIAVARIRFATFIIIALRGGNCYVNIGLTTWIAIILFHQKRL